MEVVPRVWRWPVCRPQSGLSFGVTEGLSRIESNWVEPRDNFKTPPNFKRSNICA